MANYGLSGGLRYMPGLDGLRAMAVVAVLLYHADAWWIPGGFLGVEVFFVLSGFLITSLLLSEWRATGTIELKKFWVRRARRLLPAVSVMILLVLAYAAYFLRDEFRVIFQDAAGSVFYVSNWVQIFSHRSYFEVSGRPSLLKHLWSLAVEEQFYVIWPFLFAGLMKFAGWRSIVLVAASAAVASFICMLMLYEPDVDPTRCYYGTDCRAGGLIIGALSAMLSVRLPALTGRLAVISGTAGLGIVALMFLKVNEFSPFLYRGGFLLLDLGVVAMILPVAATPEAFPGSLFSGRLLRWIGSRSYGIYLWHYPVFMITRPQLDLPFGGFVLQLVRFAAVFMLAAISYRVIEVPIRSGAAAGLMQKVTAWLRMPRLRFSGRWTVVWLLVAVSPLFQCGSVQSAYAGGIPVPGVSAVSQQMRTNAAVTAVGDSVMKGVEEELGAALGDKTVIDAEEGRQAKAALAVLKSLKHEKKITPVVVLHVGNNGIFTEKTFDLMMKELEDAERVFVVNVKVERKWEAPNNKMIAESTNRYPKVTVIDWYAAGKSRPELFWKDGLHLRPEGAKVYAELIRKKVRE